MQKIHVSRNRRRWALNQEELAHLLGISQSVLSRCEKGESQPDASVALGLQVIFGFSPRALFPDFYRKIEEVVMMRAAAMDRTLASGRDGTTQVKRRLLKAMMLRAKGSRAGA